MSAIPSYWREERGKWLFKRVQRDPAENDEVVTCFRDGTVTLRKNRRITGFTESLKEIGYQAVRKGELVIHAMDAFAGAVGVSDSDGKCTPVYSVCQPAASVVSEYYALIVREMARTGFILSLSKGIRERSTDFRFETFASQVLPVPPLEEQQKIVSFIQQQDRRIRKFIRNKKKLIGLLRDRRKQICNSIIGRGLNAEAPMKATAFPWVGEIPVHWKLTRIKNEFICLNPRRIPLSSSVRGEMSIRRYDYYGASGVIDKVDDYIFDDDLLLIAEDGANLVLRNLPLAIIARGKFWVNNHAHILKPREGDLEFLAMALERLNYSPWITGAAQPKLTKDRLMSIPIAVPSPDEQRIIVEALRRELSPLDASINQARVEIDLIGEYRSRLIADAVTGKIDLRNFQPSEEAESPDTDSDLSIDESGELNEDYNEDEELLAEAVNAN